MEWHRGEDEGYGLVAGWTPVSCGTLFSSSFCLSRSSAGSHFLVMGTSKLHY